jgi:hypothetical protein
MSPSPHIRRLKASRIIFLAMGVFIAAQTARFVIQAVRPPRSAGSDMCLVKVQGNVMNPGSYRVAPGVTQFEILKVAGIRPTSDISGFDLTRQISGDQQLEVGTKPQPTTMKQAATATLEFLLGQVSVIASDGKSRIVAEGTEIAEGDRILADEKAQAEISLNKFSRIDVDEYSECTIEKIGTEEKGKNLSALFQKSGACWYKIVYANKAEVFKTSTPFANVTVAGTGADFMIVVKQDEIEIHDIDGLLLVERTSGTEAINMISGQSAVVFRDNRPFQVTQLPAEVNPSDRFSSLTKAKTEFITRHMPFQFLLCALPGVYYFISVQFESGKVHAVHVPGSTTIDQFIQGCSTLDQAYLYGGPVFVGTLIEQIMATRIPKYLVFTREDVIRVAATFGGITVNVDEKAAAAMHISRGVQKLSGEQLGKFLRPGISGSEDFETRQIQAMKAVFDGLKSKNIVLTALLVEQILSAVETNLSSYEIMSQYAKFTETKKWTFAEHELPLKKIVQDGIPRSDPILEECKTLLQNQ